MQQSGYYTQRQLMIGKLSNLLGTPLRAAILESIAKNNQQPEHELADLHQIGMDTLRKNLRALVKGGFIKRTTVGRSKGCVYSLNWDKLKEYKMIVDELYYEVRELYERK